MIDELKPCPFCGSSAGHCVDDMDNPCVKCNRCTARADDGDDWNTRPDAWTLTADKLPEEWVPVWTQGDSGIDTCQQCHFTPDLGWFFCTRPPVFMNGRWHLYGASQEMCASPKRWRYML